VYAYNEIEVKMMKNITISLDEGLINAGREYAQKNQTTLNSLLRDLLAKTVLKKTEFQLEEMFRLMDQVNVKSTYGISWNREELHERKDVY
jgi:hypothetical protein